MVLTIKREPDETWRDCAARYGAKWGVQREVLAYYDADVANGTAPPEAAWNACYEWDVVEFVSDEGAKEKWGIE